MWTLNKTQAEMAEYLDVSQALISGIVRGEREVSKKMIHKLQSNGINPKWLMFGEGEMLAASQEKHGKKENRQAINLNSPQSTPMESPESWDHFVQIPRYNVEAGMGDGRPVGEEEVVEYFAFRRDWIKHALRTRREDLKLIRAERWYLDRGDGRLMYWDESELSKAFSGYRADVGASSRIDPIHGIRAAGITLLLDAGDVGVATVKKLARHSAIATTLRYLNSERIELRESVEKLAR